MWFVSDCLGAYFPFDDIEDGLVIWRNTYLVLPDKSGKLRSKFSGTLPHEL